MEQHLNDYHEANNSVWGKADTSKTYNANIQWFITHNSSLIFKCELCETDELGGEWLIYELITLDELHKHFKLNRRGNQTKVGSFKGLIKIKPSGNLTFKGDFKSTLID